MQIYDFKVKTRDGAEVSLSDYKGKVLLIVNTATGCGFTPHYEDLQALYNECHDKGLEILDFPCNQFGEQAPGDNEEIHAYCTRKGLLKAGLTEMNQIDMGIALAHLYAAAPDTFRFFRTKQTAAMQGYAYIGTVQLR